ncbi:hypothetical protein [Haladaptatus halobius]|uniref:hypothetical protein n=1 Tax=Haladaptatus halobius TaxID=2884875 RepID=UPI001D09D0C7|nr:hypothetical protein [Haladaptatus halobius]
MDNSAASGIAWRTDGTNDEQLGVKRCVVKPRGASRLESGHGGDGRVFRDKSTGRSRRAATRSLSVVFVDILVSCDCRHE